MEAVGAKARLASSSKASKANDLRQADAVRKTGVLGGEIGEEYRKETQDCASDAVSGGWLWIPLRDEWRNVAGKPEEIVRQHFIRHLCDSYDYALDQMAQEQRTMHGHKSPRADIVIWETPRAKVAKKTPVLVIECKAENIDVNIKDWTSAA